MTISRSDGDDGRRRTRLTAELPAQEAGLNICTLRGEAASSLLEYRDLTDEIQRCWIEDGWPNDGEIALSEPAEPSASGPARHEVSRDFLLAVGALSLAMPRSQIGIKPTHSVSSMLWLGQQLAVMSLGYFDFWARILAQKVALDRLAA